MIVNELGDLCDALTVDLLERSTVVRGGGGVQKYSIMAEAKSCDYDYDLAQSWVTENRWSMLTKQYVDHVAAHEWLDLITKKLTKKKAHGVAFLRSNLVKPRGTKRISRQWGSCMIGWSFRVFPTPNLTMHSRSTYLGFLAPLDVGVAAGLAEEAGAAVGIDPSDISFTWFIQQETFHFMRSMPWWYTPAAQDVGGLSTPGVTGSLRMINRFKTMDRRGVLYGDMAYAQERRFRMKLHSQQLPNRVNKFLGVGEHAEVTSNPKIPSVMISSLPLL